MYRANILFSMISFLKTTLPQVTILAAQDYTPVTAATLRFPSVTVSVEDVYDVPFELGNDATWYALIQNYVLAQNLVQEQGLLDALVTAYRTKLIPVFRLGKAGQVEPHEVGHLVFDKVINNVDVPLPKDTTITTSYYFVGSLYTRFLFYPSRGDL